MPTSISISPASIQKNIDELILLPEDDDQANAVPPVPENAVSRPGDLWLCGKHRVLCGDSTDSKAVARLLGERKPLLLVTDPPYGIELDSEWRDRAGLNGCGPAEASYMKNRAEGHTKTTISGDTRADWSEAFELVPSLQIAYVWHASVFTREVLNGLLRIGFLYPQQIIWNKGRTVLTRTHYWYQHEPCWYVRTKNAPWFGKAGENSTIWDSPSPKFIMGGSDEQKFDHPTQKPAEFDAAPDSEPHQSWRTDLRAVPGIGYNSGSRRPNGTCVLRHGIGSEVRGKMSLFLAKFFRRFRLYAGGAGVAQRCSDTACPVVALFVRTAIQEVMRRLSPAQARRMAGARKRHGGGRPIQPTRCSRCGVECPSARLALAHCTKGWGGEVVRYRPR